MKLIRDDVGSWSLAGSAALCSVAWAQGSAPICVSSPSCGHASSMHMCVDT